MNVDHIRFGGRELRSRLASENLGSEPIRNSLENITRHESLKVSGINNRMRRTAAHLPVKLGRVSTLLINDGPHIGLGFWNVQ